MSTRQTLVKGLEVGIKTTWNLTKVIFPVTLAVTFLGYTPAVGWLEKLLAPFMGWFGLPADGAIVLSLGNLLNLYAAIGAMLTMDLTVKQVLILSVMLGFSHNLLVETAILRKIGIKARVIVLLRLSLAFAAAALINVLWSGGQEPAQYGMAPAPDLVVEGWGNILILAIKTALIGSVQMAAIVIPLMMGIQILKDRNSLSYLSRFFSPLTRALGASEQTGVTLMAGFLFGIAYGAGVIIQSAAERNLTSRDLYLTAIFLAACHAAIEDTLLFVPLGINVLPLFLIRLATAIMVTSLASKTWRYFYPFVASIEKLRN